jgi:hypothetical protein
LALEKEKMTIERDAQVALLNE